MAIIALGYLGVRSDKLDDGSDFAGKLLGMQKTDRGGKALAFRMDDQAQRFLVSDEPGETLAFLGFQVAEWADLAHRAARLDAAGVRVQIGSAALADRRFVGDLIWFEDPMGNRVELFHAPMIAADPFVPDRPIDGFVTAPLGMGHSVMHVRDIEVMMPFYRDLLDFRVSDYGLKPYGLYFFHLNDRHHSFAMVGSGQEGFHHFMVEYQNLDHVGQGLDLAQLHAGQLAYTLRRHTNDYMTSFYAHTPSGFFVENGWGGRLFDPDHWEPHETHDGPSCWGHEQLYLTEEGGRKRLCDMRLAAAALAQVAGYACYNDASVRDWQKHTHQFMPDKTFADTGAFGPWMVTADEIPDPTKLHLQTRLNGAVVQDAGVSMLLSSIPRLIAHCSTILPLLPGDVIVSDTPRGGRAAQPAAVDARWRSVRCGNLRDRHAHEPRAR
jgi:2,3-dihydroxybiphenyl 1,2-dioxygenase